jgi:plastocyanin
MKYVHRYAKIGTIGGAVALIAAALAGAALAAITSHASSMTTRVRVTEREYRIILKKHSFKPGRVTFVVHNGGMLAHEFAVSGPGVHKRIPGRLKPGSTRTLTVRLGKGKYTLKCPIHIALGMKTTISVGAASTTTSSTTSWG